MPIPRRIAPALVAGAHGDALTQKPGVRTEASAPEDGVTALRNVPPPNVGLAGEPTGYVFELGLCRQVLALALAEGARLLPDRCM